MWAPAPTPPGVGRAAVPQGAGSMSIRTQMLQRLLLGGNLGRRSSRAPVSGSTALSELLLQALLASTIWPASLMRT